MSTKAPALSMSMFASSADYWKAQAEQADAQVARFMDQVNLQTAELETLRAKVKELALQALSDSGQAIELVALLADARDTMCVIPGSYAADLIAKIDAAIR